MVTSYILLLLLFILGLYTTLFIKLTTNNKFAAWFNGYFPMQRNKSDEQKKVIVKSNKTTITTTTTTTTTTKVGSKRNDVQFKAELKSVFATFDKNGDGYITRQELKESLQNIGITMSDKDVKEMVEKVDSNGDGLIDIEEFCELFESIMSTNVDASNGKEDEQDEGRYMKEAFNVFDEDGDGVITVEELGMVLSSLGFKEGKLLESCKEMIRKVDVDGDGKIDFDEFKMMMKAGTKFLPAS